MRSCSLDYADILGEGSIPVPLPPPRSIAKHLFNSSIFLNNPRAKAALAEIEQRLAALQHTKTEMADQKLRAETAAEIELLVRKMTAFAAEFDTAAANLFEVTRRAFPVIWEARGLHEFIAIYRAQVPSTVEMVGTLLRAHASAVVAGSAPATLPGHLDDVPVAEAAEQPTPQSSFSDHVVKGGPTYGGAARQS